MLSAVCACMYPCFRSCFRLGPAATVLSILMAVVCLFPGTVSAKMYKYKDAAGNWHFTDTPPATAKPGLEEIEGAIGRSAGKTDLARRLMDRYKPEDPVSRASLCTVTVKTPVGEGSGFFISSDGYLITNKHVVKLDQKQVKEVQQRIQKTDSTVERYKRNFEIEEARLDHRKKQLDAWKDAINRLPSDARKRMEQERYDIEIRDYENWKSDLARRKREFRQGREEYEDKKDDFQFQTRQARQATSYILVLKDGSELNAHLVSVSPDHDLALLKLDRHITPYLVTDRSRDTRQGERVYAVGSPLGLRDSVSAGVVSGHSTGLIKIDVPIYPGNSGGPLITEKGRVIGINTMKKIAYGMEGIGLSIPIETARKAFGHAFAGEK